LQITYRLIFSQNIDPRGNCIAGDARGRSGFVGTEVVIQHCRVACFGRQVGSVQPASANLPESWRRGGPRVPGRPSRPLAVRANGGSVGVATPPYPGVCRTVSREMPGSNAGGGSAWYESSARRAKSRRGSSSESSGTATPYPGVCRTVSREMPGSNAGGGSAWYESSARRAESRRGSSSSGTATPYPGVCRTVTVSCEMPGSNAGGVGRRPSPRSAHDNPAASSKATAPGKPAAAAKRLLDFVIRKTLSAKHYSIFIIRKIFNSAQNHYKTSVDRRNSNFKPA